VKSRIKLQITKAFFYFCFLTKLNLTISARLCPRRHANFAGEKMMKRKWRGARGIAATKMEMRFAIGPCNFSNLNLILDATRYRLAKRAKSVSRIPAENVLRFVSGKTHFYKALFVARGSTRSQVYCTIYVAADVTS